MSLHALYGTHLEKNLIILLQYLVKVVLIVWIVPQPSMICSSQFKPNTVRPVLTTTIKGMLHFCSSYSTDTILCSKMARGSPVYVLNFTPELLNDWLCTPPSRSSLVWWKQRHLCPTPWSKSYCPHVCLSLYQSFVLLVSQLWYWTSTGHYSLPDQMASWSPHFQKDSYLGLWNGLLFQVGKSL